MLQTGKHLAEDLADVDALAWPSGLLLLAIEVFCQGVTGLAQLFPARRSIHGRTELGLLGSTEDRVGQRIDRVVRSRLKNRLATAELHHADGLDQPLAIAGLYLGDNAFFVGLHDLTQRLGQRNAINLLDRFAQPDAALVDVLLVDLDQGASPTAPGTDQPAVHGESVELAI